MSGSSDFTTNSSGERVKKEVKVRGLRRSRLHYQAHLDALLSGSSFLERTSVSPRVEQDYERRLLQVAQLAK
eukprot:1547110-Karenia_brevis.AAC.1